MSKQKNRHESTSTVDYESRDDAITAAGFAGYDESSIVVTSDADSGRYQWALRDFSSSLGDGGTMPPIDSDGGVADVVADLAADVVADVASESPVTASPEPSANVEPGTGGVADARDLVMQIHAAMPESAVRPYAQTLSDRYMAVITLRDAVTMEVVALVHPGGGKVARASVARAAGGNGGTGATGSTGAREESIIDRIRAGRWEDSEVPDSNRTILNIKHKIESGYASCDLDALEALGGFKSTSTYYNQARAYLTWAIGACKVEIAERAAKAAAEQAAIDAEFGFDRAGVLLAAE